MASSCGGLSTEVREAADYTFRILSRWRTFRYLSDRSQLDNFRIRPYVQNRALQLSADKQPLEVAARNPVWVVTQRRNLARPVLIRQELLSNFLRSFRFADRSPRIVVRWRRVEVSGLIERCYSATAVGKLAALRLP